MKLAPTHLIPLLALSLLLIDPPVIAPGAPKPKKTSKSKRNPQSKPTPKPKSTPQPTRRTETLIPFARQFAADAVLEWNPLAALEGGTLVFAVKNDYKTTGDTSDILVTKRMESGPLLGDGFNSYIRMESIANLVASPDNRTVAIVSGHFWDISDGASLYLWNPTEGNIQVTQEPVETLSNSDISWSFDSRYLLFYVRQFADSVGGFANTNYDDVPRLYVPQTLRTLQVGSATITSHNTVITEGQYQPQFRDSTDTFISNHNSLYESPLQGGKYQVIVQNARVPFALSPDNRWLAFQGWPEPTAEQRQAVNAAMKKEPIAPQLFERQAAELMKEGLYLYDRVAKQRYNLPEPTPSFEFRISNLHWAPDSKTLIVVMGTVLNKIELPSLTFTRLHVPIPESAHEDDSVSLLWSDCRVLGFTPNGDSVLVTLTGEQGNPAQSSYTDVQVVNLADGHASTLARIRNATAVTWLNPPSSIPPQLEATSGAKQTTTPKAKAQPRQPSRRKSRR